MLEAGEFTMKRFAGLYGMKYEGMVTNKTETEQCKCRKMVFVSKGEKFWKIFDYELFGSVERK